MSETAITLKSKFGGCERRWGLPRPFTVLAADAVFVRCSLWELFNILDISTGPTRRV